MGTGKWLLPEEDKWHFAYMLPKEHLDKPTQLVIPSSLQMGWCDSPAYFCAASEMGCKPIGSLDEHPLEGMLLCPEDWLDSIIKAKLANFVHLLEVYINDFIQLAQMMDPEQLLFYKPFCTEYTQCFCHLPSLDMMVRTQSHRRNWDKVMDYGRYARKSWVGCSMEHGSASNFHWTMLKGSPWKFIRSYANPQFLASGLNSYMESCVILALAFLQGRA